MCILHVSLTLTFVRPSFPGYLTFQDYFVDISLAPLTLLEPVLYRLGSRSVLGCNRAVYHTSLNTLITTPTHLLSGHGRAFGSSSSSGFCSVTYCLHLSSSLVCSILLGQGNLGLCTFLITLLRNLILLKSICCTPFLSCFSQFSITATSHVIL